MQIGLALPFSGKGREKMLKLPLGFCDHMVLQGGEPLCVWGEAEGAQVAVSIQGQRAEAPVEQGTFQVQLPPLAFSQREELTVECGGESLTIHDVAVGEVWLAAGQSNMEFQMYFDQEMGDEVLGQGEVRSFGVPEIACPEALETFNYSDWGFWRKNTSLEDVKYHSAAAYYFAQRLAQETGHVVGILLCAWGGTSCVPWVNTAFLQGTPGEWWLEQYAQATAGATEEELKTEYLANPQSGRGKQFDDEISCQLLFGASREQQEEWMGQMPPPPKGAHPPYQSGPGRLYRTMVEPLGRYGVKGVLWYQGESDSMKPELYGVMLTALIRSWRQLWGKELPFYVVQLPSFGKWMGGGGQSYPLIRREQECVADTLNQVFLVSTMDCGARWNIHPRKKRPVGERLAKLALKETYNARTQAGSPRPAAVKGEPGKISLSFTETEEGLFWREELEGYEALAVSVDGAPCPDVWWEVAGQRMVIGSEHFRPGSRVELAFAQRGYDPVNVFNKEGFSLRPFLLTVQL